ncbi:hypothetical protein PybrP1_003253 [[Pythium] brassicae (nom. inval.)]|nr:hypothetical protein PybrP1_003253 [[Pythium] brassicae (nom. inval.)]
MLLASPRGAAQSCKYKSGKCANPRATKRNGQLHTLCHFHRVRQNEHQRKSDRKHRMVSVARRAKLGNMGILPGSTSGRRPGRASSASSSDAGASSSSTPASPLSSELQYQFQRAYVSPFHLQMPSVGTPTGRLPPISFLTQPGKLDSFRASSGSSPGGTAGLALPPPSSFMSGGGGALGSKTA